MSLALTPRRRVLTWGATREEATARLPGDELLEHADGVSTRAITIATHASAVWPWLVQMGPSPRGGAYTYDRIENLLGLDMHSVDRVLTEFQNPQVGDTIAFGADRMRIELVEPERVLSWRSENGNWVWTFVLREDDGATRLISRNRFRLATLGARIGMVPMEPASLVMERKMLLGIKERAERLASAYRAPTEIVELLTRERAQAAKRDAVLSDGFHRSWNCTGSERRATPGGPPWVTRLVEGQRVGLRWVGWTWASATTAARAARISATGPASPATDQRRLR